MPNGIDRLANALTLRPIAGGAGSHVPSNPGHQSFSWGTVGVYAFDSCLVGAVAGLSSMAALQELTLRALYAAGIAFGLAFFAKMAAFRGLKG